MCHDFPPKTPDKLHLTSLNEAKGKPFSLLIFGNLQEKKPTNQQFKRLGHLWFSAWSHNTSQKLIYCKYSLLPCPHFGQDTVNFFAVAGNVFSIFPLILLAMVANTPDTGVKADLRGNPAQYPIVCPCP